MARRGIWQDTLGAAALLMALPLIAGAQAPPASPIAPLSRTAAAAPQLTLSVAHSFVPTTRFAGTSLAGWTPLGGQWRAAGGDYVGRVPDGGSAFLLLDQPREDLAFTASFRCTPTPGCRTGVLLRAQQHGDQIQGFLYSFSEGELGAFRVTLDAQGREIERVRLAGAGGGGGGSLPARAAPGAAPAGAGCGSVVVSAVMACRNEFPGLGNFSAAELGQTRSSNGSLRTDAGANYVEVYLKENTLRAVLNGGNVAGGSVGDTTTTGYGKVALYVSGPPGAEAHFSLVGIRNMDALPISPTEVTAPGFRKRQLEGLFYSEAVTAADIDRDGNLDVISGPFVFMGPDFVTRREVFTPRVYAANAYPDPLLLSAADLTGDGYPDLLYVADPMRPGFLYVNPGKEVHRWTKHMVIPSVDSEVAFLDDIDGDGKADYIYGDGGYVGYASAGADPTKTWSFHAVSEKGPWGAYYAHGLGTGDLNGDGRKDLISALGWWEQPATKTDQPWTYHPVAFGRWGAQQGGGGGARMYAYDVNGDGLNDVVTSLEAHGWGLAWFEQKKDATGNISFVQHTIMDDFANPAPGGVAFAALHALALADVDGDGLLDIVTGKRWWAHFGENPNDPDPWGQPVVYWFKLSRAGGKVTWTPELVNNNSGIGTDMAGRDMNGDGKADIMTASRRGTFIFLSTPAGR